MTSAEVANLLISLSALAIAATTIWLTVLRPGKVRMTPPKVIYFGPDGGTKGPQKIYLRALLYSTAPSGIVIEHVWVKLRRGESQQNFPIWVYGDERLCRGSGLFVGPSGVATAHHFLLPTDTAVFEFKPGRYSVEIHATLTGKTNAQLLHTAELVLSEAEAVAIKEPNTGVYFDWGPEARAYRAHIETKTIPTPNALKAVFDSILSDSGVPKP